jgi:uncharacterized membrane protein
MWQTDVIPQSCTYNVRRIVADKAASHDFCVRRRPGTSAAGVVAVIPEVAVAAIPAECFKVLRDNEVSEFQGGIIAVTLIQFDGIDMRGVVFGFAIHGREC